MNDKELKERLAGLEVPAAGAQARDRALHRALIALDQPTPREGTPKRFGWLGLAAAAGLGVVGFFLGVLVNRPSGDISLAEAKQMLEQMNALFPGRINAVIARDKQVDLDLVAGSSEPSDQPVIIKFTRDGNVIRVLSYSGREFCVDLNGERKCFEVLVGGDNRVIITGDDFLWEGKAGPALAGFRVEAVSLSPAS